jgi:hypothetical protein
MNKIGTLAIATVIIVTTWTQAIAQPAKEFVGTWMLVSSTTEREGVKSDTFGPNPKGVLVFDAGGRYVITFFAANLPKFASNNRASGTTDENKAIVTGSLAHFGTYTVNEADKSFTFHIENATFPNWDNTEQKRAFGVSGDELKYTTPVATAGGTATLIWKRAK